MLNQHTTILGKAVRTIARMRGGGSALPGLFVEKIDPGFIKRTLAQLPQGVVIISGTNGKTTTTKMVVELLESQGLRVFTNRTGSNFARGVAAALLGEVDMKGNLLADIAVLELDEAHATHFVDVVQPRYSLLLNVMRDQLDRFGEIDKTAALLEHIARRTTDTVVLNREDPRVAAIALSLTSHQRAVYFGLASDLTSLFPADDDMRSDSVGTISEQLEAQVPADVILTKISGNDATFHMDGSDHATRLQLQGAYNIFNAAAALTLARTIVGTTIDRAAMLTALAEVKPAFGRGETLTVDGHPLELVLVKNPSGFRLGLTSFDPGGYATMIAINDNYADGRDMSWLWDVEFDSLREYGISELSGIRAYDMALRLQYDDVTISHIDPNLAHALRHFIAQNKHSPKRIFCTYTAMTTLRRELSKLTDVEVIS